MLQFLQTAAKPSVLEFNDLPLMACCSDKTADPIGTGRAVGVAWAFHWVTSFWDIKFSWRKL